VNDAVDGHLLQVRGAREIAEGQMDDCGHRIGTRCSLGRRGMGAREHGDRVIAEKIAVEPVTDRGDASGTGYFSPADSRWLPDYAERALGRPVALPRVAAPAEIVGRRFSSRIGAVSSPESCGGTWIMKIARRGSDTRRASASSRS